MNNNAFEKDSNDHHALKSCDTNGKTNGQSNTLSESIVTKENLPSIPERESWGKGVEFLMSCIAMSVGLGNVQMVIVQLKIKPIKMLKWN